MEYPTRRYGPYTWAGWVNQVICQWFWFRIQGDVGPEGTRWSLLFPVVPLTGWWGRYIPSDPPSWRLSSFQSLP